MSLEERLQEEIAAMEPELIAIRRQFHRHRGATDKRQQRHGKTDSQQHLHFSSVNS